jgi:predicted nucleic acid-binding protein
MDERTATRKARAISLQTVGTLGVLLMAKDKGLVTSLKLLLDDLRHAGFHMSDTLYYQILHSAGEAGDGPASDL